MPDEIGTETTRSDAPGADESLFGDAADDAPAAVAEGQDADKETEQDLQGSDDAEKRNAGNEAEQAQHSSDDGEGQASAQEDLKVVVSIKGGKATIGVQQPSSDPHIETFDAPDVSGLTQEVPAVVERARARWEDSPKNPAYQRPAPPARRRNRGAQGPAQDATTDTADAAQAQQQTLRLF